MTVLRILMFCASHPCGKLNHRSAVFPGTQGGPLEHVIASKAVAFGEALQDDFRTYMEQTRINAAAMAEAFISLGYKVISAGTDNHSMLIDLRPKYPDITGRMVEDTLVKADITLNKNMVPFDDRSPFQASGIRVGTPALTTRGVKEDLMGSSFCPLVPAHRPCLCQPETAGRVRIIYCWLIILLQKSNANSKL